MVTLISGAENSGAGVIVHLQRTKQGMGQGQCDTASVSHLGRAETISFAQLRSLMFPRYIEAAAGRQKARGSRQMFGRRPSPSRD